jgi:hypothetical protein
MHAYIQLCGQSLTYGIYTFIWLHPNHQNFVSSCAPAAQCLSFMVAVVAIALSTLYGVFFGEFLAGLALISILAGIVSYCLAPSRDVMMRFAQIALENGSDSEACSGESQEDAAPDAGAGKAPHAGAGKAPHAGAGKAPHAGAGKAPHAGAGKAPHAEHDDLAQRDAECSSDRDRHVSVHLMDGTNPDTESRSAGPINDAGSHSTGCRSDESGSCCVETPTDPGDYHKAMPGNHSANLVDFCVHRAYIEEERLRVCDSSIHSSREHADFGGTNGNMRGGTGADQRLGSEVARDASGHASAGGDVGAAGSAAILVLSESRGKADAHAEDVAKKESTLAPIVRSIRAIRAFYGANMLIVVFSVAFLIALNLPVQQMLFYYQYMFGDQDPVIHTLVDAWSLVYGIGGCLCGLFGGVLCDKIGVKNFILVVTSAATIVACLLPVAKFEAQVRGSDDDDDDDDDDDACRRAGWCAEECIRKCTCVYSCKHACV